MLKRTTVLFIFSLLTLFMAACVPTTEQPEVAAPLPVTETAVTTPDLLTYTWQLTAAGGAADDMSLPLPEEPAWLRFSDNPDPNGNVGFSFEGFSGCNALFGSYTVSDETLTMDVGLTQKGCEPADLLNFENYMLAVLRQQPTFTITSENGTAYLTIQLPDDESSRLVFQGVVLDVSTPSLFENTEWELIAINNKSPIPGSRITLTFRDGDVAGYAGCNGYGGPYTASVAGTLSITELGSTEMACGEPEGVLTQESSYLNTLGQAAEFKVSGEQLEIVTVDGVSTLLFTRQPRFDMNPTDLVGTAWQLESWGERELLPGRELTLVFESDTAMRGFAGCRHYTGVYFAENDAIHFPSISMVETVCEQGDDVLIQEGDFTTALSQATQYRLQNAHLELLTNPGERLIFAPLMAEPETAVTEPGCSEGGVGIFTPDDVRCMLSKTDPAYVQMLDEDTAVHFTDPHSIADWVGGAIIYHIPTVSSLVLDKFGDVDPQFSRFNSRAGLAALSEIAGDAGLMADLKQQVQTNWETTATNEPEIRLSTAWQDGETTIFLVSIAGLSATDDRFYCASQTWTIGAEITEIVSECIAHEAGTPIHQILFESKQIAGNSEQPVQVALNDVPSNTLLVKEGVVSEETAVYQTILQSLTYKPLLVRSETSAGLDIPNELLTAVDPTLLQSYLNADETSSSLRFLFQNSQRYSVNSSEGIEHNYLPVNNAQPDCTQFRNDYPALGGVASLSGIGLSEDGNQALAYAQLECGSADLYGAFFTMIRGDKGWQIAEEIANE